MWDFFWGGPSLKRPPQDTLWSMATWWTHPILWDLWCAQRRVFVFLWLIWSIWLWVVVWNVFLCWPRSLGKWSNLTIIFFKWVEATNSDRMWLLWLPVVRIRSHVVHISTMTIAESMIDHQTGWWQLKYFLCSPYLGKIPILTNIFQMVWNHQRVKNWN